ncbi:hypothetical protein ABH945_000694 [Paraburkholderia sp. GAS333]|uniref:hypothetical protein n=1 Tax=Paraburkholderia sp. GAS333 TaxID=3156279 RepID=UPI003D246FE0
MAIWATFTALRFMSFKIYLPCDDRAASTSKLGCATASDKCTGFSGRQNDSRMELYGTRDLRLVENRGIVGRFRLGGELCN